LSASQQTRIEQGFFDIEREKPEGIKLPIFLLGNNPMVGATVACAVAVEEASK